MIKLGIYSWNCNLFQSGSPCERTPKISVLKTPIHSDTDFKNRKLSIPPPPRYMLTEVFKCWPGSSHNESENFVGGHAFRYGFHHSVCRSLGLSVHPDQFLKNVKSRYLGVPEGLLTKVLVFKMCHFWVYCLNFGF